MAQKSLYETIMETDLEAIPFEELEKMYDQAQHLGTPHGKNKAKYDEMMAKVTAAYNKAKGNEKDKQAPQGEDDKNKNQEDDNDAFMERVNSLNGMQYELDNEHRKAVNHLLIETEDGKGTRLQDEFVDMARLRVLVDNADNEQPLNKEQYKEAVDKELEAILGSMFTASANSNEDAPAQAERWKDLIEKQQTVSNKVASGVVSAHLMDTKAKADELAEKHNNKNFLAGFTSKLNKVVENTKKKLGNFFKQTWEYTKVMYKQGSWKEAVLGGGLAAGSILAAGTVVAAPIAAGLAAYSGWMAYKRTRPVVDAWHKEKEINGKDYKFKDFYKAHKRDVWKAGLYTVAGTAGVVAGVVGAVAPFVNTATDTAVILNGVRGAATTTRLAAIPAATTTPYVIDYFNAESKEDKKKALKNVAIAGGMSVAALGAAFFGSELIGEAHAAETPTSETPHAHTPVHSAWGEGESSDWRAPWGQGTGIDGAPAADGAEGAGSEASGSEASDGSDAYVHQFETRVPTDAEQAFYIKRLNIVPNSEAMVTNVEGEIVHLPKGMTAEQAIHLAAMDKLYYGDDTALKLLLDCDSVKGISAEEYFNNLHGKFVTDIHDPRGMGFPTDPNVKVDPRIHAKITKVDCDDVKIQRTVRGHTVEKPIEEVETTVVKNKLPPIDLSTLPRVHIENGLDALPKIPDIKIDIPQDVRVEIPSGHATDEFDALNQVGGNNPEPLDKPKTTLTDAQLAKALMDGLTK